MSTPILWIMVPGIIAIGLLGLQRWRSIPYFVSILSAILLAWLAWQLPVGEPIVLRLWAGLPSLKITESLSFLGHRFVLAGTSRPALIMIYLALSLWLGGSYTANTDRLFIPLGFAIAAGLTASLAIQPVFYAAFFIEIVALISIPLLSPPGNPVSRGVLRFLTYQTIGMCFILFADRYIFLAGLDISDPSLALISALVVLIGFALILAVFPFHTWIPMLIEKTNPFSATFIFYIFPTVISFIIISYTNRSMPLAVSTAFHNLLRSAGVLMVLIGGALAFFDRHLGRVLGFAAIVQIGMTLLAISLGDEAGRDTPIAGIFFAQLVPQGIALALWSQALSVIQSQTKDLHISNVRGLAHRLPIVSASLIIANFSLAGLPLLASFPSNIVIWSAVAQRSLPSAFFILIGNACLFLAGSRTLAALVLNPDNENWQSPVPSLQNILLILGGIMLLVVGIFPIWFLTPLSTMGLILVGPSP